MWKVCESDKDAVEQDFERQSLYFSTLPLYTYCRLCHLRFHQNSNTMPASESSLHSLQTSPDNTHNSTTHEAAVPVLEYFKYTIVVAALFALH
jgi:hypothetical protein